MRRKVDSWKSLNALLGVYGVKTSLLKTNDDYWLCAQALWPQIKRQYGATLEELQRDIKALSKTQRRKSALANISRVPDYLLSDAPKHQVNLAKCLAREAS